MPDSVCWDLLRFYTGHLIIHFEGCFARTLPISGPPLIRWLFNTLWGSFTTSHYYLWTFDKSKIIDLLLCNIYQYLTFPIKLSARHWIGMENLHLLFKCILIQERSFALRPFEVRSAAKLSLQEFSCYSKDDRLRCNPLRFDQLPSCPFKTISRQAKDDRLRLDLWGLIRCWFIPLRILKASVILLDPKTGLWIMLRVGDPFGSKDKLMDHVTVTVPIKYDLSWRLLYVSCNFSSHSQS